MYIILIGPQGSGKGTQGQLIKNNHHFHYISTGVLLRRLSKIQNHDIAKITQNGTLISDKIINSLVYNEIIRFKKDNIIFDGYPRTLDQANFLLDHLTTKTLKKDIVVVYLKLEDEEAIRRISKRLTCSKCGFVVYPNIVALWKLFKLCPNCHGKLAIRSDDNEKAVTKRLKLFHAETQPLVNYFKRKKILHTIDGNNSVNNIYNEIEAIIHDK